MRRTAIITGGAAGLGLEVARRLRCDDWNVVLSDVDADAVSSARAEGLTAHVVDAGDAAAVVAMFDALAADSPSIDLLVNNVGIAGGAGLVEDLAHTDFGHAFAVNVTGAAMAIARVLPGMKQRRRGAIVSVSTNSVRTRPKSRAPYVASKAALEALTLVVAREAAPFGVTCNVVRPGAMDNARLNRVIAAAANREGRTIAEVETELLAYVGAGRKIAMAEVAGAVIYLANPIANGITGQVIEVDGGMEWEA